MIKYQTCRVESLRRGTCAFDYVRRSEDCLKYTTVVAATASDAPWRGFRYPTQLVVPRLPCELRCWIFHAEIHIPYQYWHDSTTGRARFPFSPSLRQHLCSSWHHTLDVPWPSTSETMASTRLESQKISENKLRCLRKRLRLKTSTATQFVLKKFWHQQYKALVEVACGRLRQISKHGSWGHFLWWPVQAGSRISLLGQRMCQLDDFSGLRRCQRDDYVKLLDFDVLYILLYCAVYWSARCNTHSERYANLQTACLAQLHFWVVEARCPCFFADHLDVRPTQARKW